MINDLKKKVIKNFPQNYQILKNFKNNYINILKN